jgi:hypothetical protein
VLSAARNEYAPFQIIVHAGTGPAVSISVGGLATRQSTCAIASLRLAIDLDLSERHQRRLSGFGSRRPVRGPGLALDLEGPLTIVSGKIHYGREHVKPVERDYADHEASLGRSLLIQKLSDA